MRKTKKNTRNSDRNSTKVNLNNCNPSNNNKSTCFDFDALVKIAKGWNKEHNKKEDKITIPKVNSTSTKKALWKKIDKKLNNVCNSEWCWIEQEFVRKIGNKDLEGLFRPKMPRSWKKNKYEWLSSVDIESVMDQYEEKYPEFKFIVPNIILNKFLILLSFSNKDNCCEFDAFCMV